MKKRLLVVSEKLWPEGGGAELATYFIVKMLAQHFIVSVFTGTEFSHIDGAQVVYIPWLKANDKFTLWLKIARNIDIIERGIRKHDVVYVPRASFPIVPIAKKLGKKVIVHLHDYIPISYNAVVFPNMRKSSNNSNVDVIRFEVLEHNSITKAALAGFLSRLTILWRLWLSQADIIICVSNRQAKIISSLAHELARKIEVIYNPLPKTLPVEEKKFECPTFTYAGGGSYIKGFYVFAKMALNVLRARSNITFFLLRSFNPKQREVMKMLNDVFTGKLRLLGFLPYEDVLRLYSKSHAVLVPSISEEPLPYVVMEAMAMGTIPIASNVGGIPEIVKETYAEKLLFTPGCSEEMTDRVETVLSLSRDQLADVGSKLREITLKRFNNKVIEKQLLEVFSA